MKELDAASEDVEERKRSGLSRLIVMAPANAEVYVNDERKASVGSSGRVVLTDIPAGQHILRVSRAGDMDDERVIEVREGAQEQVIQAQLRKPHSPASQPSPSQGSSSSAQPSSLMPGIVACVNCHSRFAEGVKFCGRCGGGTFALVSRGEAAPATYPCPRCSSQLPQNSRFCGRCGLSITPAMQQHSSVPSSFSPQSFRSQPPQTAERLCTRCGNAYPLHIRFCGRCGLTLQ
jgi:NADH pyrophosphatase NudC (nudix superfamily)